LKPDTEVLDEVVVTGYGTFKKSSFTGSASNVTTEKLQDLPSISVQDRLAGSVAGVQITSTSGQPGSVASVRIRGMGSINASNEPLYVIDGVPMLNGNVSEFTYADSGNSLMATLNSNDIESMTVIKDAAAASLYGSRAANGVIVITTKKGSAGKTKIGVRADWVCLIWQSIIDRFSMVSKDVKSCTWDLRIMPNIPLVMMQNKQQLWPIKTSMNMQQNPGQDIQTGKMSYSVTVATRIMK
jgi:TonB-dependent SusC/RagA subfamily outer membrane receptor